MSPARRAEGDELARRFFEVAGGGDLDALLGMLAPDMVLHGDGKARAIGKSPAGPRRVNLASSATSDRRPISRCDRGNDA